jgi:squalene monooxygenase
MKKHYNLAVREENFKVMPNHYMAAKPVLKEGAVLLGDALNMRHPLTGGGITAVFSDVYLLGTHLIEMPDFSNADLIHEKIELYYKDRQFANANVNILANALYGVMSNDLLKTAVFRYIGKGGDNAYIPISILAGLNRNQKTLVQQFFSVVFFGAGELLRENILNIPRAWKILMDALKIIKPLVRHELSFSSIFTAHHGK